ncbi:MULTISPECIES: hypothetical protein [unclassified Aeromicrobium]|uniref:hypothetical protein n=1 Tax=unclassified Aeromicrobium TaxID=2633570 RepID=UPI00288BE570|nr:MULTISPECIES: hypothetical protein [unclassified Aeromicrobium]
MMTALFVLLGLVHLTFGVVILAAVADEKGERAVALSAVALAFVTAYAFLSTAGSV